MLLRTSRRSRSARRSLATTNGIVWRLFYTPPTTSSMNIDIYLNTFTALLEFICTIAAFQLTEPQ